MKTSIKKELKIGNTTFLITSIYTGNQKFENILFDWVVNKTIKAIKD